MIRRGPLAWRFWVGVFSQRRWVVGISVGRGWSPLHLQGVRLWVCGVWPLQMCWGGFMFCQQQRQRCCQLLPPYYSALYMP